MMLAAAISALTEAWGFLPLDRVIKISVTAEQLASRRAWAEGYSIKRRRIVFVKTPVKYSSSGNVTERILFMLPFSEVT
jgi:hypothetical protein